MSKAEWAFKRSLLNAYISQTTVSEQVKVQQLRTVCDDDLLRRVYDAGDLASLNTETLLQVASLELQNSVTCLSHVQR